MIIEDQLKLAHEYHLVVLLHIPKYRRLRNSNNIREITEISQPYPGLKLIIAHVERSYWPYDIIDNIDDIKDLNNVFVDTAMINNWEVIEILLNKMGSKKIIYGSDFPVAALRGKNICINNRHYFATAKAFKWSISGPDIKKENMTFFIYEEIREIIEAIKRSRLGSKEISDIFYCNAKKIIDSIKARRKELE
jgi:uncharacterized protein